MTRATPEGDPILCRPCQVVMLPDHEADYPTAICPKCGCWVAKVY